MKIINNEKNIYTLDLGDMAVIRNENGEEPANVIMIHGDDINEVKLIEEKTTFDDNLIRYYIALYINNRYVSWFAGFRINEIERKKEED